MPGGAKARRDVQPGGHPLRPEVVAFHQRQRILKGAAEAIGRRGYRQVAVSDIVKASAIARARFYENFSSKEDCFFAVYDAAAQATLEKVAGACEGTAESFPERVGAGISALLDAFEADPDLARACIVEGPAVGPAINGRFEKLIGDFAALLRLGRGDAGSSELPDSVEETVVGGLYWLLYHALIERRPRKIAQLRPQLVEFSLIPFIGTEAAAAAAG
jgi:AcrR family transcriptional regulator